MKTSLESGIRMYKRHAGIESSEEFYLISSNGVMYSIEEPNFESMGSVNSSMVRYILPDVGYEDATGETHYEIKDHLGNLRVSYTLEWCATCGMECQEQTVEYRIDYVADYFAYGGIMREYIRLNTEQERFLSTGNERDKLTGWDYRNARYYDSDIGRFLGVDPLYYFRSWMSPYNYVQNNPISRIDPMGALDWEPDGAGNLIAQFGDNAVTLSEHLGLSQNEADAIYYNLANWDDGNSCEHGITVSNFVGSRLKIGQTSIMKSSGILEGNGSFTQLQWHVDYGAQGGGGMGLGDAFEIGIGAAGTYFSVKGNALHNELYWKGKTTGKIYTTGKYGTTNHLNMRGGYANSYKVVGKPLQATKSLGTKLGYLGLGLTAYDMIWGEGLTTSNVLDATFGAAGFIPGIGWAISGSYFLLNTGVQLYSGKSIGEHWDD